MSGIPTYTRSPINAAKASGITPRTASPPTQSSALAPPSGTTAGPLSASTDRYPSGYPAARPGAPAVPATTTRAEHQTPSQQSYVVPPTGTAALPEFASPAPPQPGPLPAAPASYAAQAFNPRVAPPLRAGETSQQGITLASTTPLDAGYAAQTGIPPPPSVPKSGAQPPRLSNGSVMERYSGQHVSMPLVQTEVIQNNMQHPYGYMQRQERCNAEGSQAATGQASAWTSQHNSSANQGAFGEEEGVWDTTKKWAKAVAKRASEAESQLWRRINQE